MPLFVSGEGLRSHGPQHEKYEADRQDDAGPGRDDEKDSLAY
jgi:hypothetical protein